MSFDFEFTVEKLQAIIPKAEHGAAIWYELFVEMLPTFEINTLPRVAAFIAQTAHESAGYTKFAENLNYSAQGLVAAWPKRFPNLQMAQAYHRQPEKIANRAYSNRLGNGNEASGDGYAFRGRGLIQLTGRYNYTLFSEYSEIDLEVLPQYVESPRGAVHSACWFWFVKRLNTYVDNNDFEGLTLAINGGLNGYEDRVRYYNKALDVFIS